MTLTLKCLQGATAYETFEDGFKNISHKLNCYYQFSQIWETHIKRIYYC